MRLRFTVFLLVANLFVFGLIWHGAGNRNREQPPAELIFPVNADRIELSGPDAPGAYTLEQRNGHWDLRAPYEWPANPWVVQKILDELRFVSREGGFTLDEAGKLGNTPAAYGLENPRMTIAVSAAGAVTAVKVGSLTPDGNGVYLLSPDGNTVLPAPKSLLAALARKPEELRRPEVIAIDPFEISSVTLSMIEAGKEVRIGLKRGKTDGAADPNAWKFETPVASDADTPEVDKQLTALSELRFRRFFSATPDLLSTTGLAAPAISMTLEGTGRRQTLQIGGPDQAEKAPYRFAKFKNNAAIFTIPEEALKPWLDARRALREHRFLRFDVASLTGITVHQGGRSLVLQRLESAAGKPEWHMPVIPGSTASAPLPVDNELLTQLATSLSNLTARDFIVPEGATPEIAALCGAFVTDEPTPAQLAEWGFSTPERRVELSLRVRGADGKDSVRTVTLAIAAPVTSVGGVTAPRGTPYHAKLSDSPTVYSVAPAVLASLTVKPHAYRKRSLDTLAPGARISAMTITDLATGKVLLDERKPDDIPAWETWLEKRPADERVKLLALADRCRDVRADRFLPNAYADDFRYDAGDGTDPEAWRYKLEYTVKSAESAQPETRELRFTRRLSGTQQLGGSRAHGAVFMLNQDWIDALRPLTFGLDSSPELPPMPTPGTPGKPPAS